MVVEPLVRALLHDHRPAVANHGHRRARCLPSREEGLDLGVAGFQTGGWDAGGRGRRTCQRGQSQRSQDQTPAQSRAATLITVARKPESRCRQLHRQHAAIGGMSSLQVTSVNVGSARNVAIQGRLVRTAIAKQAVAGPVAVAPLGLAGDEQADLSVHGGLAKALYAYPALHYPFWQTVRAQAKVAMWDEPLAPGAMGENLTLQGVDETMLWIGDHLRFPGCVLVVSEPRMPCFKFNAAMGFAKAARLMHQSGFCGAYLAVLQPGRIAAGESFTIEAGPREVNLRELFRARSR